MGKGIFFFLELGERRSKVQKAGRLLGLFRSCMSAFHASVICLSAAMDEDVAPLTFSEAGIEKGFVISPLVSVPVHPIAECEETPGNNTGPRDMDPPPYPSGLYGTAFCTPRFVHGETCGEP